MRILAVIAHLDKRGGQQTQCASILEELSRRHEVLLLMLRHPPSPESRPAFPYRYVGELGFPSGVMRLRSAVRRYGRGFDIVQCFDPFYALPAVLLSGKRPRVLRIGADPIFHMKDLRGRRALASPAAAFFRAAYPCFDRIVVNSAVLEEQYRRYGPVLIPNGFPLEIFRAGAARDDVRRRLALPLDSTILLYTGKIGPWKNLDAVLAALAGLPASITLVIVGIRQESGLGTGYLERLRAEHAGVLSRVRFVDELPRDDVIPYLHAADIFVFPSRKEGSPNALIEAMCASLPVVCSDIPAHRFVEDGRTGLRFASIEQLREQIARLASRPDERSRLGEAARAYAAEHFSIEAAGRNYERLYEDLLSKRTAPAAAPAAPAA